MYLQKINKIKLYERHLNIQEMLFLMLCLINVTKTTKKNTYKLHLMIFTQRKTLYLKVINSSISFRITSILKISFR